MGKDVKNTFFLAHLAALQPYFILEKNWHLLLSDISYGFRNGNPKSVLNEVGLWQTSNCGKLQKQLAFIYEYHISRDIAIF